MNGIVSSIRTPRAQKTKHLCSHILEPVRNASESDKADAMAEAFQYCGIKTVGDIVNFSGQGLFRPSPRAIDGYKAVLQKVASEKGIQLATTGEPLLNGTSMIIGVMEQITPMIQTKYVDQLFPEASYAAQQLELDIFDAVKGMLPDTPFDAPVPTIAKRGLSTIAFRPASTQAKMDVNQSEYLFLRDPGNSNLAIRGITQYLAKWTEQLAWMGNIKRINQVYRAICYGDFDWENQNISYGIPSGNRIVTDATLSGSWGTITDTNFTVNSAANPILDLSAIFNNQLKKYRGFKMKIIMNPATNQLIVQNPNVISRTPFIYANNSMVSPGQTGGVTADTILKYYFGGDLNIDVEIDNSVYTAGPDDPNGYTENTEHYLFPDYYIWIYIDTDGFGKPLGEYCYTLAAQNGGLQNPKAGKYMWLVDSTLSNTVDGISQPRISFGHGWNGSPWILRKNDIFTINVGP